MNRRSGMSTDHQRPSPPPACPAVAPLPIRTDVAVIGGGLAGLAAARLLSRHGVDVIVLDGQRLGGRARSDRHDGFTFNRGPHALYRGGAAEGVLGELGIRPTGGAPSTHAFGLRGGRVARLPVDARTLLTTRLIGWRAKTALATVLRRLPAVAPADLAGVTVRDWLDDLGLSVDATQVMEMLVRISTYGNAPEVMSAELAVGQVQMALANGVRYLDGGWQSLVDSLAVGVEVHRAQVVTVTDDGGRCVVATADDRSVLADAVIVAAGTPQAAAAVLGRAPFAAGPPIEAACLDLGVRHPAPRPVLFGVDEPLYLSTHQPPAQLAPPGAGVVSVARYLAPGDALSPDAQRAELHAHARRAGIDDDAVATSRYLHRMTVVGAMATAAAGGLRGRVAVTDAGLPGVFLAGDWIGSEGHLADASFASARRAAQLAAVGLRARA